MRSDKPDAATAAIVEELRARGYVVVVAKGAPYDLTVTGHHRDYGITYTMYVEVKTPGNVKFTQREVEFQAALKARGLDSAYVVAINAGDITNAFGDR